MNIRVAVSNTDTGVLVYLNEAAVAVVGNHVSVNMDGDSIIIRQNGPININDGKHNKTEINRQGFVMPGSLAGREKFGKTEFNLTLGDNYIRVHLKHPMGGEYQQPRNRKAKIVEAIVDAEEIRNAIRVINGLNREEYFVSLSSQDNKISVKREEHFS